MLRKRLRWGWVEMVTSDVALELVDILRRRAEIVACLVEDSQDKRTLVEEVDSSRSTLDRALRELESVGIVTYTEGEYTVTSVGQRLVEDFFGFLERGELAIHFEPFLRWIPSDEFEVDLRWLDDAELVVPAENNPYAMVDKHVQLLKTMEDMRGMLPLTGLHAYETAHESIVEDGATSELIITPGVAEVLTSDPCFAELTEEMIATGRFKLFVYEGPIPYFVGIFDDEIVQIGADEDGEPRALVETDRQEIRTWASDTLDNYKQQATALSQMAPENPLKA